MIVHSPLRPDDVRDFASLRKFVCQTLSERFELSEGAFPISEQMLRRGDHPCGIHFCLHGPRAVRFTAIWESDQNQIYFYGEQGQRVDRIRIPNPVPFSESTLRGRSTSGC